MNACPSEIELQKLLAEELIPAERETIEHHVESCANCQEELDRLVQNADCQKTEIRDPQADARQASDLDFSMDTSICRPPANFLERLRLKPPKKNSFSQTGLDCTTVAPASGSVPPRPVALPVLPGYEILEVLGRGGMGIVYKARHLGLQRIVALKMMHPSPLPDAEAEARFRREAEAVARLQHPNIVQIFDIGESAGGPYLALEYVGQGSLARHINGRPQPVRESAQLMETLARAIHFAHLHGIVHRDLKPANILLSAEERVLSAESEKADSSQHSALSTLLPRSLTLVWPNGWTPWATEAVARKAGPSWVRPATWRPSKPAFREITKPDLLNSLQDNEPGRPPTFIAWARSYTSF